MVKENKLFLIPKTPPHAKGDNGGANYKVNLAGHPPRLLAQSIAGAVYTAKR
jgi:hypothetical protein